MNVTQSSPGVNLGRLGREIRRARERRDWSQPDLAARCGVNQSTVSRWERGGVIEPSHLGPLVRTLDLDVHLVAMWTGRPESSIRETLEGLGLPPSSILDRVPPLVAEADDLRRSTAFDRAVDRLDVIDAFLSGLARLESHVGDAVRVHVASSTLLRFRIEAERSDYDALEPRIRPFIRHLDDLADIRRDPIVQGRADVIEAALNYMTRHPSAVPALLLPPLEVLPSFADRIAALRTLAMSYADSKDKSGFLKTRARARRTLDEPWVYGDVDLVIELEEGLARGAIRIGRYDLAEKHLDQADVLIRSLQAPHPVPYIRIAQIARTRLELLAKVAPRDTVTINEEIQIGLAASSHLFPRHDGQILQAAALL